MEMLARWLPTTPEMEVKILFGRHVWDCAQHADHLGKRAFELRAPLQYTLAAVPECQSLLSDVAALMPTTDRVSAFYGILCPSVTRQYEAYVRNTDPLLDEPTVRILEQALRDYARMSSECDRYAGSLRREAAAQLPDAFARGEALTQIVAHSRDVHHARGSAA